MATAAPPKIAAAGAPGAEAKSLAWKTDGAQQRYHEQCRGEHADHRHQREEVASSVGAPLGRRRPASRYPASGADRWPPGPSALGVDSRPTGASTICVPGETGIRRTIFSSSTVDHPIADTVAGTAPSFIAATPPRRRGDGPPVRPRDRPGPAKAAIAASWRPVR